MNIFNVLLIRIIEGVLKFLFVHVVLMSSRVFLGVINFVITVPNLNLLQQMFEWCSTYNEK